VCGVRPHLYDRRVRFRDRLGSTGVLRGDPPRTAVGTDLTNYPSRRAWRAAVAAEEAHGAVDVLSDGEYRRAEDEERRRGGDRVRQRRR